MAELDTYTKLVTRVESWLNRENFTALTTEIPYFVEQGMRRIQKENLNRAMLTVDGAFAITGRTVALPTDFDRVESFHVIASGTNTAIRGFSYSKVVQGGQRTTPDKYTILGDNFFFNTDGAATAELVYYKKLPIPSASVATNWVLENEPELLFWATLIAAAIWLKDDTRKQEWVGNYAEILRALQMSEERMDMEDGSLQVTADTESF